MRPLLPNGIGVVIHVEAFQVVKKPVDHLPASLKRVPSSWQVSLALPSPPLPFAGRNHLEQGGDVLFEHLPLLHVLLQVPFDVGAEERTPST